MQRSRSSVHSWEGEKKWEENTINGKKYIKSEAWKWGHPFKYVSENFGIDCDDGPFQIMEMECLLGGEVEKVGQFYDWGSIMWMKPLHNGRNFNINPATQECIVGAI